MKPIFLDSETIGFVGPMVLLQYAEGDNEPTLYNIWLEPIKNTLEVIEYIVNHPGGIIGFNLSFDWFHLVKIYNILYRIYHEVGFEDQPIRIAKQIQTIEPYCRNLFLKPTKCLDLMIHARKGKYQTTMGRKNIIIKKVPTSLALPLANILKSRIKISGIHFAKSTKGYQWTVRDHINRNGEIELGWSDIVLRFAASTSLEALAQELLGEGKGEWVIPKSQVPKEQSWKPFQTDWARYLDYHVSTWAYNKLAQDYARRDVTLLQKLYPVFGSPPLGDVDSELTIAVANARWKGFKLDDFSSLIPQLQETKNDAPRAPNKAKEFLRKHASNTERATIHNTRKETLQSYMDHGTGGLAKAARRVFESRKAESRLRIVERLNILNRSSGAFHPDFKVLGTKSNRMSGGSEGSKGESVNPQGIPTDKEIRNRFLMADSGEQLDGGDFTAYEIVILAALYDDPNLTRELQRGKKFHALMAKVWLDADYEEVLKDEDTYFTVKTADFAWIYGARDQKLSDILGVSTRQIMESEDRLKELFPQVAKKRAELQAQFCSMTQPGGLGTKVIWKDPAEYTENLFGFRRYFTLENQIVKALYDLAQDPPPELTSIGTGDSTLVKRSKRLQTVGGAIQSAVYAAAFALQAANMRAASNHPIQSTGAEITKAFQKRFWDEQPVGIHLARIRLFQIHDELLTVHNKTINTPVIIVELIKRFQVHIPLLAIAWKTDWKSWGSLK